MTVRRDPETGCALLLLGGIVGAVLILAFMAVLLIVT